MTTKKLKLQYEYNTYYICFYETETVQDLKEILSKKYKFVNDHSLEIYQNNIKLQKYQKITDIQEDIILRIVGHLAPKLQPELKPQKNEEKVKIDYLPMFRDMGFNESKETIDQLMQKNDNKLAAVISALLIQKKKTKKSK